MNGPIAIPTSIAIAIPMPPVLLRFFFFFFFFAFAALRKSMPFRFCVFAKAQ
jgi:hypothetical protein